MNIDAIKKIKIEKVGKYQFAYTVFDGKKFGIKNVAREERTIAQEGVLRAIKGNDFSLIIMPISKNAIKLSFRSTTVQVGKLAKYFGGGGHNEAAGAVVKMPVSKVLQKLCGYLKRVKLPKVS